MFFKPSWKGPEGVWGGLVGVWGAVGLEKPIDSMTCKLTPTTKIDLEPVLLRSGSFQHQKKHINS